MRIGVDVDGVLANYNDAFIDRCITVTGKDLFPPRPFEIPMWEYPKHYGYTTADLNSVQTSITADRQFWESLAPYSTTEVVLGILHQRIETYGDDVYFITDRPGRDAKRQTEHWLKTQWPYYAPAITVLISSHKGLCAKALQLDYYTDDRDKNVLDVVNYAPDCRVFLLDRPWNRTAEAHVACCGSCRRRPAQRIQALPDMFTTVNTLP